ncbi:PEP/pyruvate-binding domain-containing protein [Kineococcus sp. SYSU DK006]|uniref:PEP/pyruvate-binding domain-containing protein n=1 Tax=Kineococcus sp. SYSU DK006 TaxID=3383127 RepID=UPI003D7D6A9D
MLVPLREAGPRCGAKAATLARLLRAGLPVPAGVVVLDALDGHGWQHELETALGALGGGPFAVRSSAVGEDGGHASFAGQLHTHLGARTPAEVVRQVRRSAASGAAAALTAYTARLGRSPDQVAPAGGSPVLVQVLVDAEVAGVLFTHHPVTGAEQVVVEATRGLGEALVSGRSTPQRWLVDPGAHSGAHSGAQPGADTGALLTSAQLDELVGTADRIEALLGAAQDVEWAIAAGRTWILQARPITTTSTAGPTATESPAAGLAEPGRTRRGRVDAVELLLSGTPASPGTATGPARTIRDLDDFARFHAGEVLVCRSTSPAWTPLLARAAAVVTEVGGILAHAAIVAREFGIPAVTDAAGATGALTDGRPVHVDGTHGTVTARTRDSAKENHSAKGNQ